MAFERHDKRPIRRKPEPDKDSLNEGIPVPGRREERIVRVDTQLRQRTAEFKSGTQAEAGETEFPRPTYGDVLGARENPLERLEQAQRDEKIRDALKGALDEMIPRDRFFFRLRAGVLTESPMQADELEAIFNGQPEKLRRIRTLVQMTPDEIQKRSMDFNLFDNAVLDALGMLSQGERIYSLPELQQILGLETFSAVRGLEQRARVHLRSRHRHIKGTLNE